MFPEIGQGIPVFPEIQGSSVFPREVRYSLKFDIPCNIYIVFRQLNCSHARNGDFLTIDKHRISTRAEYCTPPHAYVCMYVCMFYRHVIYSPVQIHICLMPRDHGMDHVELIAES